MKDSSHGSDSGNTIQYTVTITGDEHDHRAFRVTLRENEAEIYSELPVNINKEGRPEYIQNLLDQAVEVFENKDLAPIEATMEVVIPNIENMPVETEGSERTVYDILRDLQQLESLTTEELVENIDETDSNFNNYRLVHSPEDPEEHEWGKATLKGLAHASLETYIVQELRSIKDVEKDEF
jgi:hypothetical protein